FYNSTVRVSWILFVDGIKLMQGVDSGSRL
ncbi:unnamed protein product, partial [Allacma fusca]